jgi:hypothetical protein
LNWRKRKRRMRRKERRRRYLRFVSNAQTLRLAEALYRNSHFRSRDSVVGIATSYGLYDRGSEFESR